MPRPRHPCLRGQTKPGGSRRRASVRDARRTLACSFALAAATAATVAIAGTGEAAWVCVPAALLAAGAARGRLGATLSGALVLAAAVAAVAAGATEPAGPTGATGATHPSANGNGAPRPSVVLLVLVTAASVAILLAVRERLERERDALRTSALSDPLTGVANRRALLERIDYEIARHERSRRSFAVLMLDLDGFKLRGDRFGHPAGDDLLCEVARALARAIRDQDTLARVGGDEFCVLAPETDDAGARRLVGRVGDAVARVVAGVDSLGASAGAALFPHDGSAPDQLLQAADQRLLGAKRKGGTAPRRAA